MTSWDAIVIGAGPAGIGAATVLARHSARVLVVDEAPAPGGQIWRGIEAATANRIAILGPDYAAGAVEVEQLRASGAQLALSTQVWRVEPDRTLWLKSETGLRQERAPHLIVATGAMERPVPVKGWTLPGVTTIGGLQILLKRDGLLPQGPLALVGTGPLLYLYAAQVVAAGKRDVVLLDTARIQDRLWAASSVPGALLGKGPSYLAKGVGLLHRLRRAGVPHHSGVRNVEIVQMHDGGLTVSFDTRGRRKSLQVARIGLHEGVIPETHLLRSLDCRMEWSEQAAAFQPERDHNLCSSLANVHVAGDAGGIGGANVALLEGRLAAMAVLERLGHAIDPLTIQATRRERRAHLAARPLIEKLYRPGADVLAPPDEVVACRCEEVKCGDIRTALDSGCAGPNQLKAFLRCGMGPCQGRICGPTLANLTAATRDISMAEAGWLSIRPPLRPISLGDICDLPDH